MKNVLKPAAKSAPREDHWIPLSDLMTGLMMVFMLIAVFNMIQVNSNADILKKRDAELEEKNQQVKTIALLYDELREQLYNDLSAEFKSDLPRWKATLEKDLTLRFQEPDVLFDIGKSSLKPQFSRILDNFFPRYIRILSNIKYRDTIEEIRIEGHTSSVWAYGTAPDDAYIKNMELSQSRTRSTLQYLLLNSEAVKQRAWLISHLTANGLSSSRLRLNPDGTENKEASQRVEFRVRTNAEDRIGQILQAAQR